MNFDNLRKGMRLLDRGYLNRGTGIVVEKTDVYVTVNFANGETMGYNRIHAKFLLRR